MPGWDGIVGQVGRVPAGAWMAMVATNLVLVVLTWSRARRQLRRAGERLAGAGAAAGKGTARDTALTVAAMIPAALFWGMVLAGSLHGLVAFGRNALGWNGGWEYLVPGTLDGVSVAFGLLAFRAVRKQKAPDRCQRVVWGAALASATVNFAYEYSHSGHNAVAGGYLALLSLFGMVMFHEFLDQFEEGTAYLKRENPKFGLRWLTWPSNTFCAAVAWRNHPPVEGTAATVLAAVANLDRVRAVKAAGREAAVEVRHERDLARERRRMEVAAARAGTPDGVAADAPQAEPRWPITPEKADAVAPARSLAGRGVMPDIRVPATAATLVEWMGIWVRMCADGDVALGPLSDGLARDRYGLSGKQLRNIRHAATSGALRHRAAELGIAIPAGYVDNPATARINGREMSVVPGIA